MSEKNHAKPKAWKLLGAAVGLAVAGGAIWWASGHQGLVPEGGEANNAGNVANSREAPRFELKGSDGKVHRLEDLKGNAVVLHFWASWCPPCLGEITEWLNFASQWKGRPVRFVAVSLDQSWPDALKILPPDRLPENVISVLDEQQKLPDEYGTYQYPETYLLSPDLKIISKWVGPQEWSSPAIVGAIEKALPR